MQALTIIKEGYRYGMADNIDNYSENYIGILSISSQTP